MNSVYDTIRSSLWSTEIVLAVVDVFIIPNSNSSVALEPSSEHHDQRFLVVVSHKDQWAQIEEGALFVYKSNSSAHSSAHVDIQSVYPIYGNFSIVMSQMRRQTLDLRVANAKAVLDQPRSGFSLTIHPAEGHSHDLIPPTFYANDAQSLGTLISECKRLKDTSDAEKPPIEDISQTSSHFRWLRPYLSKHIYLSILSPIPPDLRIINKPLIQRLSPASAGLPGDDNADLKLIRDEWMRNKGLSLVRQGRGRISLRLGTFNVNGKLPSQDLSSWIQGTPMLNVKTRNIAPSSTGPAQAVSTPSIDNVPKSTSESTRRWPSETSNAPTVHIPQPVDDDPDPDLYVLGFQELDLSAEALLYSTSTVREDAWCMAIFAALGEKAVRYEKLTSKQLVGMLMVVIVKKSVKHLFGDLRASSMGSGILGVMGNKGATAVRLTFTPPINPRADKVETPSPPQSPVGQDQQRTQDTDIAGPLILTFVNAHLAAFDEMLERRNQDFHELSKRLVFERDREETDGNDGDYDTEGAMPTTIYESDILFWMGDLNYRVDIPDHDFRKMLADKEWDDRVQTLILHDQLKKAIASQKAFDGFLEHPVMHLPTYRFSAGFGMDELGYDQKRKPAWTDRVLYMPGPSCEVKQHSYTSYPQVTMSDHRPVAADFTVDFDLYEKSHYESVVKQLYREAYASEISHDRPVIKVDQNFLDFGELRYHSRLVKKLVVKNVGKLPCAWRFVSVQPDSPIHPEWLSIEPMTGMILPDEQTEIIVTAYVHNRIAASLNLAPRDISGTLILHTILGKDYFISVSGEYLPSCFGNKLTTLTRLPGHIRSLSSTNGLRPAEHHINAPREIMRLVNRLMANTAPPKDLFLSAPDEVMVETIRECLDTGEEFPWPPGEEGEELEANVLHAIAATLVRLLDSLIEPIIPPSLHAQCVQMTSRDEAFELLDALQPAAVNVWITITAFLHFICQSSGDPSYAEKIADIFVPVLMRDDPDSTIVPVSPIGKRKFFLCFIT